jgi:hypothetical protein
MILGDINDGGNSFEMYDSFSTISGGFMTSFITELCEKYEDIDHVELMKKYKAGEINIDEMTGAMKFNPVSEWKIH